MHFRVFPTKEQGDWGIYLPLSSFTGGWKVIKPPKFGALAIGSQRKPSIKEVGVLVFEL